MYIHIGVGLPTIGHGPDPSGLDVLAAARHAENLGLESVWVADHLIPPVPILDSTITLAAVAAATERLHLGFSVMILALRPLAWAAKQIGTLQHISGGRVLLGVGIGGAMNGTAGWNAAGIPFSERGPRTDSALRALPSLLAGQPTTLGHEPDNPQATLEPPAPMPPVLIGGNSSVALRRAAAYGDAWFPTAITPQVLASRLAHLRTLAAKHARPTPTVTVGIPAALATDSATRNAMIEGLAAGYGLPIEEAARIPLTGTVGESAERLAEYAEAGASRAVLMAFGNDWRSHYELAAELRRP